MDFVETTASDMKSVNHIIHHSVGRSVVFFLSIGLLLLYAQLSGAIYQFSQQDHIQKNPLDGAYRADVKEGIFFNQRFRVPEQPNEYLATRVLGATSDTKRIEIDLTNQRLYAFENENKVYDFLISSGKWNKTPTGVFRIWVKLRYTLMKGGSELLGTYYYLPNVPYTMFFANREYPAKEGYGIHAAYWHNNFGSPMSHGCINMKEEDAALLYYWADPTLGTSQSIRATTANQGTEVIIYGTTPST